MIKIKNNMTQKKNRHWCRIARWLINLTKNQRNKIKLLQQRWTSRKTFKLECLLVPEKKVRLPRRTLSQKLTQQILVRIVSQTRIVFHKELWLIKFLKCFPSTVSLCFKSQCSSLSPLVNLKQHRPPQALNSSVLDWAHKRLRAMKLLLRPFLYQKYRLCPSKTFKPLYQTLVH